MKILQNKCNEEINQSINQFPYSLDRYTMVSSCPEERKMFRVSPMHYVIYDEAHMLKNMSTQRYDNLLKIKVMALTNYRYNFAILILSKHHYTKVGQR